MIFVFCARTALMSKKNVQVILSDEELALIGEAAARKGVGDMRGFIAGRARLLLLSWAVEVIQLPGAVRGGSCNICKGDNALWFNSATKFFVCEGCATRLNAAGGGIGGIPLCGRGGPDRYVPVAETEAALEKALAAENSRRAGRSKAEQLVDAVLAAADAYRADGKGVSPNEDVVGFFKQVTG